MSRLHPILTLKLSPPPQSGGVVHQIDPQNNLLFLSQLILPPILTVTNITDRAIEPQKQNDDGWRSRITSYLPMPKFAFQLDVQIEYLIIMRMMTMMNLKMNRK
ncbi:hypothetical protein I7I50_06805 [Histoplasma capsulatum G186AR]|uniref:Uncharacterized protein n=1 Tax=Ajellomyces capsulatus TaxID=5037 RepID=A0A8H7Z241_AJECA|nr:hypothetical protein I7I52_10121 [Histoplasma capsulatum]QSS67660.1 hypothetical protein I7I50_06805 [Histoplasma capsulatum G186AR]